MTGLLVVVNDVEAYLATHVDAPQPRITEWKLADLVSDLAATGSSNGNPAAGKDLFSKLACVQCHKLGQVGYPYGPDLAEVWSRYKGIAGLSWSRFWNLQRPSRTGIGITISR